MASVSGRERRRCRLTYTLREPALESRHRFGINSLAITKDTQELFTAGRDSCIRSWSTANLAGVSPLTLEGHCDWVNKVIHSPISSHLFSASSDTTVRVWGTASEQPEPIATLCKHTDYVKTLAFAPAAQRLASGGLDRTVVLWDLEVALSVGHYIREIKSESAYAMEMNDAGTLVMVGSPDGAIRLWDPRTSDRLTVLRGHSDTVRAIALAPDGTRCLSASSDGTLKLWEIGHQRCIATLDAHTDSVWALAVNPSFTYAYSGSRDGCVMRTDLRSAAHESVLLFRETSPVLDLLIMPDEKSIFAATTAPHLRQWPIAFDTATAASSGPDSTTPLATAPIAEVKGAPAVIDATMLPDRVICLTQDSEGNVQRWNVVRGTLLESLGPVDYKAQIEKESVRRCIPTWCTLDTRLGALSVILDEDFLAAFVAGEHLDFCNDSNLKLNLGAIVVQALLRHWHYRYMYEEHMKTIQDTRTNAEVNHELRSRAQQEFLNHTFFDFPENTLVVLSDLNCTFAPLRFRPKESGTGVVYAQLSSLCPTSIRQVMLAKLARDISPKIHFYLKPDPAAPTALRLDPMRTSEERLSAVYYIGMDTIYKYVVDAIKSVDVAQLDIWCNGEVVPQSMDMASVRKFVWKKSDDILFLYRRRKA